MMRRNGPVMKSSLEAGSESMVERFTKKVGFELEVKE